MFLVQFLMNWSEVAKNSRAMLRNFICNTVIFMWHFCSEFAVSAIFLVSKYGRMKSFFDLRDKKQSLYSEIASYSPKI